MKKLIELVKQKCEECEIFDANVITYYEKNIVCIEIEAYGILCFKETKITTNCLVCEYFIPTDIDHMYSEDIDFLKYFVNRSFLIKENYQTEVGS